MKIKHNKAALAETDMTPMIDMTFQLIAFFMIVSNFEQTNADERVKLPADRLARPPITARENEVTLNVGYERDASGKELGGPYIFYGEENVPVLEYKPRLQREYRLTEQIKGKAAADDVTVVIRADGDVPTGMVQELIKMGQEVGFSKFSLKAKAGEEEN